MTRIVWEDDNLRSHARIAARLAQWAAQDLIYVRGVGWHYWDGKRWAEDHDTVQAHKLLSRVLEESWQEAMSDPHLQADVKSAMSAHGARGVLEMTVPRLYADQVDADPYLLNCQNGTLDLHTLELRPHDPADKITKVTLAAYRPEMASQRWLDYLESALPDASVRDYLQTYSGLTLIGTVIEHVLTIATGNGRNGKSVFAESLAHALGDYAIAVSSDMLIASKYGAKKSAGEQAAMMRLRGSRFVTMSELPKGVSMDESTTKMLTGGDTIEAKLMGQNPVNFEPSHSFLMLTNDLPKVDPDAQAVWDRIRVVPFDVSFRGREDKQLKPDLRLAADAILTWTVEGLRRYQSHALEAPEAVVRSTQAYHDKQDCVAQFIEDECVIGADFRVKPTQLVEAFNAWAAANGEKTMTAKAIAPKLKAKGYDKQPGGQRAWLGIGLKADEDAALQISAQASDQGKRHFGHFGPVNPYVSPRKDDWGEVPNVPDSGTGRLDNSGTAEPSKPSEPSDADAPRQFPVTVSNEPSRPSETSEPSRDGQDDEDLDAEFNRLYAKAMGDDQ